MSAAWDNMVLAMPNGPFVRALADSVTNDGSGATMEKVRKLTEALDAIISESATA